MVVGVTNPDNPSNVTERNNIKKPGQFLGKYVWVSKTGKWDSGRLRIGPISEIIELAEGTVNI